MDNAKMVAAGQDTHLEDTHLENMRLDDGQRLAAAPGPRPTEGPRPAVSAAVVLTPEQMQRRRRRNIAIGLTAGFLALLFYFVTIVKLGPGMFNRPL